MMPLVKPPTIAPPIEDAPVGAEAQASAEADDDYDEVTIEGSPAEVRPARGSTSPPAEAPRRRWAWLPWSR